MRPDNSKYRRSIPTNPQIGKQQIHIIHPHKSTDETTVNTEDQSPKINSGRQKKRSITTNQKMRPRQIQNIDPQKSTDETTARTEDPSQINSEDKSQYRIFFPHKSKDETT